MYVCLLTCILQYPHIGHPLLRCDPHRRHRPRPLPPPALRLSPPSDHLPPSAHPQVPAPRAGQPHLPAHAAGLAGAHATSPLCRHAGGCAEVPGAVLVREDDGEDQGSASVGAEGTKATHEEDQAESSEAYHLSRVEAHSGCHLLSGGEEEGYQSVFEGLWGTCAHIQSKGVYVCMHVYVCILVCLHVCMHILSVRACTC
jgi:hypothetical protein